jgi:predicted secreted protein
MIPRIASSLAATVAAVILLAGLAIVVSVRLFGLTHVGALSLYFVIWWIALFVVLPFGVRSQHEDGAVTAGTDPGAPSLPRLREKALWTTLLAGAVLIATAFVLPLAGL